MTGHFYGRVLVLTNQLFNIDYMWVQDVGIQPGIWVVLFLLIPREDDGVDWLSHLFHQHLSDGALRGAWFHPRACSTFATVALLFSLDHETIADFFLYDVV